MSAPTISGSWWSTGRACWPTSRPACAITTVSIESLIQRARNPGEAVPIVLTTHQTTEANLIGALGTISELSTVLEPPRLIRIETL